MKYTPGPWYSVQYANYHNLQSGEYFGDPDLLNEEISVNAEANAKLAAAAPDMLEALQNIENDGNSIPEHAWELIQDAIKKATL